VGEEGGFDAVADVKFGEQLAQVPLHGSFAEVEFARDLGVRPAVCKQGEKVVLPGAESRQQARLRVVSVGCSCGA
jgi:hypothetical protein